MPKPFKHPQIKALEVGQSCTVQGSRSAIKRSAEGFGKRNCRRYSFVFGDNVHFVTRDPDPLTDTELPGA